MRQLFIILLSITSLCVDAQGVRNVLARQSGNQIIITYDLKSAQFSDNFSVNLLVSLNGGHNWSAPLSQVRGDIGNNIKSGTQKRIVWDVLSERQDLISNNVQFKIQIQKISSAVNLNGKRGQFVDKRDGSSYRWVKVGAQIWMAENLHYEVKYNSFSPPQGAREIDKQKYGLLYNYKGAREACPEGWHLPNNPEWFLLLKDLGGVVVAGTKLKTQDDWFPRSGNNASGMNVRPTGIRPVYGGAYMYQGRGKRAYFWSADDKSLGTAHALYLRNDFDKIYTKTVNKNFGLSVRCIKN